MILIITSGSTCELSVVVLPVSWFSLYLLFLTYLFVCFPLSSLLSLPLTTLFGDLHILPEQRMISGNMKLD